MVRDDRLNVLIHHYGDLDLLQGAVDSVPDTLPVHVVDGRFEAFSPGSPPLTPGTRAFCRPRQNVHYHAPDPDRLPFGVEFPDAPPTARPGVHAKARYSYYEVLPGDEWALQIDTDERLLSVDLSALDALDREKRYQPSFTWGEEEYREWEDPWVVPRVTVPDNWTLWIDDCGVPRSELGRENPLPVLRREWVAYREGYHGFLREAVHIRNFGPDARNEAYNRERADHLRAIGRRGRADQILGDR